MTSPLHPAELPDVVYRLGREPDPWEWPDWSRANPDRTFGNRYDDPEGQYRVLYASTQRQATFRECLARFRPDPAIVAAELDTVGDEDAPVTIPPGIVLAGWAIFEPNDPIDLDSDAIELDDRDLLAVLNAYGLELRSQ